MDYTELALKQWIDKFINNWFKTFSPFVPWSKHPEPQLCPLDQLNGSHLQAPNNIHTPSWVHFLQAGRFAVGLISHSNPVHFVPAQIHLSETLFWSAAKRDCCVLICLNESHQKGEKKEGEKKCTGDGFKCCTKSELLQTCHGAELRVETL